MATNSFSPAVPEKAKDVMLGEGIIYVNYGESGEAVIGATRGGSKLEINRIIKDMMYDGALGSTKGLRRVETYKVALIVNFLKLTYSSIPYGLNVTVEDGSDSDGTYKKITFRTGFLSTDVVENVTFKGFKANGEYCIIIVKKALDINNIEMEFKSKDEVICERTYNGFYTYSDPVTPPLEIREEITA